MRIKTKTGLYDVNFYFDKAEYSNNEIVLYYCNEAYLSIPCDEDEVDSILEQLSK